MPELWRSHPHRQIAFPVADKLCGAGRSGLFAIFKRAQTGRRHDAQKIRLLTAHTSDLLFIVVDDSTRNRTGERVIFTQNDVPDFGRNRRGFCTDTRGRFGRQNEDASHSPCGSQNVHLIGAVASTKRVKLPPISIQRVCIRKLQKHH